MCPICSLNTNSVGHQPLNIVGRVNIELCSKVIPARSLFVFLSSRIYALRSYPISAPKSFASVSANFENDHEEPEVSNKSANKEEVKASAGLINTQPSLREHAVPVPSKSFSSQDSLENYDI